MHSLKNKKIGIVGLGITGVSIYSDITHYTQSIICWDDSEKNRNIFECPCAYQKSVLNTHES